MAKVRIELNRKGVRQLLRVEMAKDLLPRAERIAVRAGEGHRVESDVTRHRARAVVVTDTPEAMLAEAKDRNLSRALEAGRG